MFQLHKHLLGVYLQQAFQKFQSDFFSDVIKQKCFVLLWMSQHHITTCSVDMVFVRCLPEISSV